MPPLSFDRALERAPSRERARARTVGLVYLVMGLLLVPAVVWAPPESCSATSLGSPAGLLLSGAVIACGVMLAAGLPRAAAVTPALALGSSLPLLGAALGVLILVDATPCEGQQLGAAAGLPVIQGGAALAVAALSVWLLHVGRELAPWRGSRGVVVSTAAASVVFVGGAGAAWLSFDNPAAVLFGPLPWAVALGLTGWLRLMPARAVLLGPALQLVAWLAVSVG